MKPRNTSRSGFEHLPPELSQRLADLITAHDDMAVIETLRAAMKGANLSIRAPRGPGQGNNYVTVPDHRVRILAAKILAEIKHGRPRQSVDFVLTGFGKPLGHAAATRELLNDWEEIKRIGDQHVAHLRKALPAAAPAGPMQNADAASVDVEVV